VGRRAVAAHELGHLVMHRHTAAGYADREKQADRFASAFLLDLINAVEYRRAYKAISARGWRKSEPHEPEPEHPELIKKAMTTLWERRKIGAPDIAAQLH
jgi:Zn-dependent peptidase ImmA (M78 family)